MELQGINESNINESNTNESNINESNTNHYLKLIKVMNLIVY